MLELLISQLLRGQGESFGNLQSLLRLLGPLGELGQTGIGLQANTQSSPSGAGLPGLLRVASGVGGAVGITGLLRAVIGTSRQTTTVPTLPLGRYQAAAAYHEEYGFERGQGVQSVVRQDEFGRSEIRSGTGIPGSDTGGMAPATAGFDGRMLLQYSDEIAQAVRQALLYSHPLSEVLSE